MKFQLSIIIIFTLFTNFLYGKVDPPNYNFSLEELDAFMPGKALQEIEKKYKFKEVVFKDDTYITYKFFIEHIRYKFPILVQFQKGIVTDFHARLPQYFLHDIFHQSLINRLGSQDIYKKKEEQAIYIWKNKNNLRHYYAGGCSITCFPIFYAVKKLGNETLGEYKSILQRLEEKEPSKTKPKN